MTSFVSSTQTFDVNSALVESFVPSASVISGSVLPFTPVTVAPAEILSFLARLRLLAGVPFGYLVADADLLPAESIRFFYLDRNWTDALTQGALSVGTVNSADRAQLEALYPTVRTEVDETERNIRVAGGEQLAGPAGPISGFLLRSRAVSGWPGIHVRGYNQALDGDSGAELPESDPRRVKMLRLERLAPAVLLALFDGVPQEIHIEEPRVGIQFGVRFDGDPTDGDTPTIPVRNAETGDDLGGSSNDIDVPFRSGAPGVIDVKKLAERLSAVGGTDFDVSTGPVEIENVNSAEFSLQMLRFPYREVFGDPATARDTGATANDTPFRPEIAISDLVDRATDIDLRTAGFNQRTRP